MFQRRGVSVNWFGNELMSAVRGAQEPGLYSLGFIVLKEARLRAPVKSGRLRRSGYVATSVRSSYRRRRKDKLKLPRVPKGAVQVGFASFYGRFIEIGARGHTVTPRKRTTRGKKAILIPDVGPRRRAEPGAIKARPFLGPALQATRERGAQALAVEVNRRVERAMARQAATKRR
jgi:hypothetical protein